ncbi:MAG TPA: hypothetical protein VEJ16_10840 [Alphaproteobacteria bacterium]|nr:hypothetical protein [Alphaproteobacteria bacterium]
MADNDDLFTGDFATNPYWWDEAPPLKLDSGNLPSKVDVAIVGAGITGLNAALPWPGQAVASRWSTRATSGKGPVRGTPATSAAV